jgi:hypothetical protein
MTRMTTLRQAAERALAALEQLQGGCTDSDDGTVEAITVWCPEVIEALRAALAQPEAQPGEWGSAQRICNLPSVDEALRNLVEDSTKDNAVCVVREVLRATAPAQAERKPLTDEEILAANYEFGVEPIICETDADILRFARAIERAHGITGEQP